MHDRVPTPGQEGRVLITPENGDAAYYAKLVMADNPTQAGTPLNKETLLQDSTAALYGMDSDAVPDDIFSWIFPQIGENVVSRVCISFKSSGNFVAPQNMLGGKALIVAVGGGGAGGAGNGGKTGGGGGGSGRITIATVTLTPGTTYSVVVGAGGQTVNGGNGGNGGTSSFGTLISASGGNGGYSFGNGSRGGDGEAGGGGGRNGGAGGNGR